MSDPNWKAVQFAIGVVTWEGRTSFKADHLALFVNGRKPETTLCGVSMCYGGWNGEEKTRTAEVRPWDYVTNLCKRCKKSAWAKDWESAKKK